MTEADVTCDKTVSSHAPGCTAVCLPASFPVQCNPNTVMEKYRTTPNWEPFYKTPGLYPSKGVRSRETRKGCVAVTGRRGSRGHKLNAAWILDRGLEQKKTLAGKRKTRKASVDEGKVSYQGQLLTFDRRVTVSEDGIARRCWAADVRGLSVPSNDARAKSFVFLSYS